MKTKYLSTSSLADVYNVSSTELFSALERIKYVLRKDEKWELTDLGKEMGGEFKYHEKYGTYIVWPETMKINFPLSRIVFSKLLNATTISQHYNISAKRLNLILSELGWIEKGISGWKITKLGKKVGGEENEHDSGNTYVLWPESILSNKNLQSFFSKETAEPKELKQKEAPKPSLETLESHLMNTEDNFRSKFPATMRARDGHFVRSRAELLIDNMLFEYKLAHAYEKKLPIEEEVYCDFFISQQNQNVFIEYWGLENDNKYLDRKKKKIEIYKKYDFKLIELFDKDIENLDDALPKKLLQCGIRVYL